MLLAVGLKVGQSRHVHRLTLDQCGRGELLQFWRLPALNLANVVEIAARDRRGGAPAGRVEESADPSAASFYADQNLLGPNTCERGCRNMFKKPRLCKETSTGGATQAGLAAEVVRRYTRKDS